jgi:hypothetical protein
LARIRLFRCRTSKVLYIRDLIVAFEFERIMRRSETLQKLAIHRDDIIKLGVKTLAVFGSVARDEARQDSDVDILVEFQDKATFDGYMDLKFFLEDLLGRPVDLVTKKSIRPRMNLSITPVTARAAAPRRERKSQSTI